MTATLESKVTSADTDYMFGSFHEREDPMTSIASYEAITSGFGPPTDPQADTSTISGYSGDPDDTGHDIFFDCSELITHDEEWCEIFLALARHGKIGNKVLYDAENNTLILRNQKTKKWITMFVPNDAVQATQDVKKFIATNLGMRTKMDRVKAQKTLEENTVSINDTVTLETMLKKSNVAFMMLTAFVQRQSVACDTMKLVKVLQTLIYGKRISKADILITDQAIESIKGVTFGQEGNLLHEIPTTTKGRKKSRK